MECTPWGMWPDAPSRNEDNLYRLFGVNAELLIDHAWGWEPCTIADVKVYKPETNSIGSGQVLKCPYTAEKARLVVHEMADALALELVGKRIVTNQVVLTVGYDIENLTDPERKKLYKGTVTTNRYGRSVPKHAYGTEHLAKYSSSAKEIVQATLALFDRVVDGNLLIRRLNLTACDVITENDIPAPPAVEQLDLFTDYSSLEQRQKEESAERNRERRIGKYEDILYLLHHISPTRRRMTMAERAAQFSPFAALTGYEDAVWETGRITERKIELSEDEKVVLDQKQQIILTALKRGERIKVTVTYFHSDKKKDGGEYIDFSGEIKKIEDPGNVLVFTDGTEIPCSDILDLKQNVNIPM